MFTSTNKEKLPSCNVSRGFWLMILLFGEFSTVQLSFRVSSWMVNLYCLNSVDKGRCKEELKLLANPLVSYQEFNPLAYDSNLFCEVKENKFVSQSLGEALTGARLQSIPYSFKFNRNVTCQHVCSVSINSEKRLALLKDVISKLYTQRWYGDGVPVSYCLTSNENKNSSRTDRCLPYFLPGCSVSRDNDGDILAANLPGNEYSGICASNIKESNKMVIFNHLVFTITYREEVISGKTYAQIIFIDVDVTSAKDMCSNDGSFLTLMIDDSYTKPFDINYSYTVNFVKNNQLPLTKRLEYIFYGPINNYKEKWFALSALIFVFVALSILLGLNFYNLLRKDILRYTQLMDNAQLDIQDEYGWKLLQGDVFRPPKFPLILATSVGFGVQLICMVLTSLLFAALGLLADHTNRALMTCVVVFYLLFGVLSGYVSSRLYKFFGGINWKRCVVGITLIHPIVLFAMIFGVNFWLWIYSSPSAIRISMMIGLFFLWLFTSAPLSFLGSYIGFKQRSFFNHRITCIILGGFPPFLCLYFQLNSLIKSVWVRLPYAMFGFLFVVALIATIVCAEVVVLLGYFHLSSEDYRWQWRSFFSAASTSLYCLVIVMFYYYMYSHVTGSLGAYAYFTYSFVVLYMLALALGSVGFLSCFFVFLKMYSSIKVD